MTPSRRSRAFDVALAIGFAGIAFWEAGIHADGDYPGTAPALLGASLAALGPLPLAARRSRPLLSTAAVAALLTVPHAAVSFDVVSVGGLVPLMIALEGAGRHGARPWNRLALLFPVPGLVLLSVVIPGFANQAPVYLVALLLGWTWGVLFRALTERRAALAGELEAEGEAEALRLDAAVAAERTRVARELHDVIARCVGVMVLQAGAARLRLDVDAAGSAAAIAQIEATGHEALADLRRVLGLLRADAQPGASLARLDDLLDQVRAAGLDVRARIVGDTGMLPTGLDRSLFRVVQEGLTNALKHGAGAAADLAVSIREESVEVEVANATASRPRAPLPGGHGQLGMRERVAAFGGAMETSAQDGRYLVRVRVPLGAGA